MKKALVIGKFMPPHTGHLALISHAADMCQSVTVYVDLAGNSPIPVETRYLWLRDLFINDSRVKIVSGTEDLPQAETASRDVSKVWADFLSERFPETEVIVSSEKYGDYLAEYMGIQHLAYDPPRNSFPVSGSAVRESPSLHWDFIPEPVRPYYLKKVCLYGPESTGKSTLAQQLADHYSTVYVPEMAREVLGERNVSEIVYDDFPSIGEAHALKILEMEKLARGVLFSDTDIFTTEIYSERYFGRVPLYPEWVYRANTFDLYLFCDTDLPWVEDPHRNSGHLHHEMRQRFMEKLESQDCSRIVITGIGGRRFEAARLAVDKLLKYPSVL